MDAETLIEQVLAGDSPTSLIEAMTRIPWKRGTMEIPPALIPPPPETDDSPIVLAFVKRAYSKGPKKLRNAMEKSVGTKGRAYASFIEIMRDIHKALR